MRLIPRPSSFLYSGVAHAYILIWIWYIPVHFLPFRGARSFSKTRQADVRGLKAQACPSNSSCKNIRAFALTNCQFHIDRCTYTASGVDQGAGKCFMFSPCDSVSRGCMVCSEVQFTCSSGTWTTKNQAHQYRRFTSMFTWRTLSKEVSFLQ